MSSEAAAGDNLVSRYPPLFTGPHHLLLTCYHGDEMRVSEIPDGPFFTVRKPPFEPLSTIRKWCLTCVAVATISW